MIVPAIGMALSELRRNALRSALTMLGMVIGVGAVIAMVTLGRAATLAVTDQISSLGDNLLLVHPGAERRGPPVSARPFDNADVRAIERGVAGRGAVAPQTARASVAVLGSANHPTLIQGTTPAYLAVRRQAIAQGSMFADADVLAGRPVCVLGETVRRELFRAERAVGQVIRVGSVPCTVTGVLEAKGSTFGADQDDVVLMPITAVQRRLQGTDDVGTVFVSVEADGDIDRVHDDLTALLRDRRHIRTGEPDDFDVGDMREIAATVTNATTILTAFLGAIGGVSLLVGGIGIMNIMLVSVTERTREIGLRLAIGARSVDVLWQFLVEAIVLCLLGGTVGIGLGLAGSYLGTRLLELPFPFDPTIVAIAFVFCACVGVVFGFLPARRAARMDPIEALRHD